jgi:hypothetical protein
MKSLFPSYSPLQVTALTLRRRYYNARTTYPYGALGGSLLKNMTQAANSTFVSHLNGP